jgi:hypothetical protein
MKQLSDRAVPLSATRRSPSLASAGAVRLLSSLALLATWSVDTAVLAASESGGSRVSREVRAEPVQQAPVRRVVSDPRTNARLEALIPEAARAATCIIDVDRAQLEALAQQGGGVVRRVPLGPSLDVDLELTPVQPFDAEATIEIMRETTRGPEQANGGLTATNGTQPRGAFLAGKVVDAPNSHAFLAASDVGVFGYVELGARTFIISSGPYGVGLPTASYELTALPEGLISTPAWTCSTPENDAGTLEDGGDVGGEFGGEGGIAGTQPCRQIRIAYETDHEFLQLFSGNTNAATAYVATLASALTSIYTRDVNARLNVRYLRLWQTSADPWNQTSTSAELEAFAGYWQATMGSVIRDLSHFLSGRGLGGGVAYLPGICASSQAYGLSANLAGFFPTPLVDNNGQNWDIYVVAHELGHNFGAPHTHNYSPVLDGCGSSPQDCSAANADEGTIMSYCHLCSGGVQNIKLRFHPGNIASMESRLNSIGCNYTGPVTAPVPVLDTATAFATVPVTIDVLANDLEFNCEALQIASVTNPTANGGTVTRSIGSGPGGRDQLVYTMPNGSFSGSDTAIYRIRDASGQELPSNVAMTVTAVRTPENPVGAQPQLDVAYYTLNAPSVLPNFSTLTPYATATAASINYPSTTGNFASSGRADNLGAVFQGWVDVPTTGVWTLFLSSDDGSRCFVGNTLVVNNDGLHGMVEASGTIALAAGRHAFRVEFFERTGGAGLIASWQGPGVAKAVIPNTALSRGGVDTASDLDNNGNVNAADLAILLAAWDSSGGPADINRDGAVNGADLAILLSEWAG